MLTSAPAKMKIHNFNPGPCILPQEVFRQASEAVLNFNDSGLSILEVSHRGKAFIEVMERARSLVKEVLQVPEGYQVLYLQGGASLGFYIAALNFMKPGGTAAYVVTGEWAGKALKEAKRVGDAREVASSKDKNFSYIPKKYGIPTNASYLHLTSNNTIFGTQIRNFPPSMAPVICDMSSDIFSRRIDASRFMMIYAGAQKNLGPAGTTVYIVREEALGKTGRDLPAMLDLKLHIEKESMYNTPPVFAVYVCMLTLEWLKKTGGVSEMEKRNQAKADLLYSEIDNNPLFTGTAAREDRSNMNLTFVLSNEGLQGEFDRMWKEAGIDGLKGHRSVGGYRASLYNALPIESVQVLVDVMRELGRKSG